MRILGITIPNEKRLDIGLTELYGIGLSRARKILDEVTIPHDKKSKDLTPLMKKIRSVRLSKV